MSFPRTIQGGGFPSERHGDNPFSDRPRSAGVFLLNCGTDFFPPARDAFRVFAAASSIQSRTTARLRVFPIAARPASFTSRRRPSFIPEDRASFLPAVPSGFFGRAAPFHPGRTTRPGSSPPDQSRARRVPSIRRTTPQRRFSPSIHRIAFFPFARDAFRFFRASHPFPDDGAAPGLPQSRRGPLLSHPSPMAARIISERGGLHPIHRTTPQRRGFHPGGAVRFVRRGRRPERRAAVQSAASVLPSHRHDADRTDSRRGGGRPILDDAVVPASQMTDAVRLLPSPTSGVTIRRHRDDDSASSVSPFSCLSLSLCAWLSIAGNKVPPAPDDLESMGGTNSKIRDPTPALPRGRVNVRPHPPRPGHPLPHAGEGKVRSAAHAPGGLDAHL